MIYLKTHVIICINVLKFHSLIYFINNFVVLVSFNLFIFYTTFHSHNYIIKCLFCLCVHNL